MLAKIKFVVMAFQYFSCRKRYVYDVLRPVIKRHQKSWLGTAYDFLHALKSRKIMAFNINFYDIKASSG